MHSLSDKQNWYAELVAAHPCSAEPAAQCACAPEHMQRPLQALRCAAPL